MRWRVIALSGLLLLTACTSETTPQSESKGVPAPATTAEGSTTASTTEASGLTIDVIGDLDPRVGVRIDELATFGYRGRPSTSPRTGEHGLAEEFPSLAVRKLDLGWGIDSSATVVAADGEPKTIEAAALRLADSTPWVQSGPGWLVALYKGGLSAPFEMEALHRIISWFMAPDGACQQADEACPFDADMGFPPPPPQLIVNADPIAAIIPHDELVPFEIAIIEAATNIEMGQWKTSWIRDGVAYTSWGDPTDPAAAETWGPASLITGIGCSSFILDPGTDTADRPFIAPHPCNDQAKPTTWAIPADWNVTGLAIIGNDGQGDYRLIVTADRDDSGPVAVQIPIDDRFFTVGVTGDDPALGSLPPLNHDNRRWSLPHRNGRGDLVVVEERTDGWYLVNNATTLRQDLLRASHPIISYTTSGGNRHIILVVDGPDGPSTWWIHDDKVTRLDGQATSVAWAGTHPFDWE